MLLQVALDDVALQLTLIRFYLRLAKRLTLMTVGQYEHASERLTEIGRLLQAWRKTNSAKITVSSTVAR